MLLVVLSLEEIAQRVSLQDVYRVLMGSLLEANAGLARKEPTQMIINAPLVHLFANHALTQLLVNPAQAHTTSRITTALQPAP